MKEYVTMKASPQYLNDYTESYTESIIVNYMNDRITSGMKKRCHIIENGQALKNEHRKEREKCKK